MNIKKILFFPLIFACICKCVYAFGFSDVRNDHKNYNAITLMSDKKILTGYEDGTFRPDDSITRAELCVVLARTLGSPNGLEASQPLPFSDVTEEYWAYDFINFASSNGIINGMGDGTFLPAGKVTFEQAVKMIVCAAGLVDKANTYQDEFDSTLGSDSKWYLGYIEAAEKMKMLLKVDTEAGQAAKRADVVQIIFNAACNNLFFEGFPNMPIEKPEEIEKEESTDKNQNSEKNTEIKKILVDPGHNYSGLDNGARSPNGKYIEENITWQISDKLRQYLEAYGFEVYMTRPELKSSIGPGSVKDSLSARVDYAHELGVDLFVSIHCNAGGGTGVETYCYDLNGSSAALAKKISSAIASAVQFYNRGAKEAGFYVIKNTAMPSVLVETGFIDNSSDVAVLSSEDGQHKIAKAIADAINGSKTEIDLTSVVKTISVPETVYTPNDELIDAIMRNTVAEDDTSQEADDINIEEEN